METKEPHIETEKNEDAHIFLEQLYETSDYVIQERRLYRYLENGTIYWLIVRGRCFLTTTEIVSLFGCGYINSKKFILHKFLIDPPPEPLGVRRFMQYLFREGHKGEDVAMAHFRKRFPELLIVDPFFVDLRIATYETRPQMLFHNLRLGASTDGFIVHPETNHIIGVVEAKTCVRSKLEDISREFTCLLISPSAIQKNRKYRYLMQILAQCVIMNLSFGILLLYDPKTEAHKSYFVYFKPQIRRVFMDILLEACRYIALQKFNVNSAYNPYLLAGQIATLLDAYILHRKFWDTFNHCTTYICLDHLSYDNRKCWVEHIHCALHSIQPLQPYDCEYEERKRGSDELQLLFSIDRYVMEFLNTMEEPHGHYMYDKKFLTIHQ